LNANVIFDGENGERSDLHFDVVAAVATSSTSIDADNVAGDKKLPPFLKCLLTFGGFYKTFCGSNDFCTAVSWSVCHCQSLPP
jgi:hypothetical protein